MKKEMKKQDLLTGDIVVTRDGSVGIVLAEKEAIVYSESGMDFYDDFTEDLLLEDDYRGCDIMVVYRDEFGGVINFTDYKDYDPIFEREDDVVWTEDMRWENQQKNKNAEPETESPKKEVFHGMIQALYGNRTGIDFTEDSLDGLIMGCLDSRFYDREKFDRSIIRLPEDDGLVLIYNKYEEEHSLQLKEKAFREDGYVMPPLAAIPELNIELYSRCLTCRVDEDGKLGSLRKEDYEKVMKYLAK